MNSDSRHRVYPIFAIVAAFALASCGGSGGTVNSGPLPVTPTPTPTQAPTGAATPGPAGFYPLPSDAPMAAFGGGVVQRDTGTAASFTTASYDQSQLRIDFDPATQDYSITIPNYATGRTVENTEDATPSQFHRYFDLVMTDDRVGFLTVTRKAELNLTYTTIAWFGGHRLAADGTALNDQIFIATGIPTASGDVPLSGTASYSALAKGWATAGTDIEGNFQLTFDFATSGVTGRLALYANDGTGGYGPVGTYPVVQGSHDRGATSFAGSFDVGSIGPGAGSFEGIFMGPGAAEIGGRWRAPVRIPAGQGFPAYLEGVHSAAGVFAGARQ
jgi:hypothetical protein